MPARASMLPGIMENTVTTNRFDALLEALQPESIGAPTEALERFTKKVLARASDDFFTAGAVEDAARDLERLYELAEHTPSDGIGVRVSSHNHRVVVLTAMPDCPFIVETLREHLGGPKLTISSLLHPVVVLDRELDGRILKVRDRTAEGPKTSLNYAVLEGHPDAEALTALEADMARRLELVVAATSDFQPMLARVRGVIADLEESKRQLPWRSSEFEEIQDLLQWLSDGNFVLLGYREYEVNPVDKGERQIGLARGSSLGILKDESASRYWEPRLVSEIPADLRARVLGGPPLIVSKTNSESPVHRRARMDDLSIKRLGPDGETLGERRFLGLFTAKAFSQDAANIPILRRKLREILEAEQADKGSHDYGLIIRIFNTLPKEELFLTPVSDLVRTVETVMDSESSDEVLVRTEPDALGRGMRAMVIIPRERFSADVRLKVQDAITEACAGTLLNYHLAMGESAQARLHFYFATDKKEITGPDLDRLQTVIRDAVKSWTDRLKAALARHGSPERVHELLDRYATAFAPEYIAVSRVESVVSDIACLERLRATGDLQVSLSDLDEPQPNAWYLNLFAPSGLLVLSDVMPILENLGFRVVHADAYDIKSAENGGATVHTFYVQVDTDWLVEREEAEGRIGDTVRAIHRGDALNTRLNTLVLSAGLSWRQVSMLRAYATYLFRIGAVASLAGGRRPLTEHPEAALALYHVFEAMNDPRLEADRQSEVRTHMRAFHRALEGVRSIDDDRTCRRLLNLVVATVRTNFFQTRARLRPGGMISVKFDAEMIEVMPSPRPKFEIYVSSANTEGSHLRMDDVARGGIRWSDRTDDFRVEVLGLVKTQQVKNSVIVPAGAKGAFVLLNTPADRADRLAAGVRSYTEFIRGLLDLTDNVREGAIVPPTDTVIMDEDDPYLVVAADKGTAKLSDTANNLAAEYDFWLGDAFASGGSNGYDHKEQAITARGAWECVKRHFRELGKDIQEEEFTVVGIGDMSGDVFGNGMLLSKKIRLIGAFDHRHIFLDPNPDPERGWEERQRLFADSSSSWSDYDSQLISEGGGVFERGAKSIDLSTHARARLDIEDENLNGEGLVRAILQAPADLLWNGGIGTYVKATNESHGEVGDPGNDSVRLDASELRVRVVGEGGNLGFTQAGRVEFAQLGGRLNTDALDNSGGVDMSDHEVNLKILLNQAVESGSLPPDLRDGLLMDGSVVEAITADVLRNNYSQSLAVSLDEHRVKRRPDAFRHALESLERCGILDRQLEGLPHNEEMIDREVHGQAELTRPELAILLAYSKMHLEQRVRADALSEDEALFERVVGYYPAPVIDQISRQAVVDHRLRRRSASTLLTNLLVDLMGGTGHLTLARDAGRSSADVAEAWYAACSIGDAESLAGKLQALDLQVPAAVQAQWLISVADALGRATEWLLATTPAEYTISDMIESSGEAVARLREQISDFLPPVHLSQLQGRMSMYRADGLGEETASELVTLETLDTLLPVARLARLAQADPGAAGRAYFGLAEDLDVPRIRELLSASEDGGPWQLRAAKGLLFQLDEALRRLTMEFLKNAEPGDVAADLTQFRERCASSMERVAHINSELESIEAVPLSALMVLVQAVTEVRPER
ncbi:MAG: NAD-glutamate dehydrogenase domain-containing protein [Gemmatimonadota bacterium]